MCTAPFQQPTLPIVASTPKTDVTLLAKAVKDSIVLIVLFTGKPIQFTECKASFMSLIGTKNITSADKLHYLRKYVRGPARKTLDGIFYRNDDKAYNDAWEHVCHRYGQPFIIQAGIQDICRLSTFMSRCNASH